MRFVEKVKYAPFYLLSLLPMQILYLFSDLIYFLMYRLVKYRKKVVRYNLNLAFPHLSQVERTRIEKKFYQHFCDLIFEAIKALSIKQNNLLKRIRIVNPELVEKYNSENKSIILYSGHLGNWEWMLSFPLILKSLIITFYLPLSNKYFSDLIKGIRGRFGVVSIEAGRGYKALLSYAASNIKTFTLFLADQSPHRGTQKHWTTFFNQDTAFNIGINAMALKTQQVVLFPYYRKISRGYYEIELITIWDGKTHLSEYEIIDIFAAQLEIAIRESPHLWLWTHRRWKLKREENEK